MPNDLKILKYLQRNYGKMLGFLLYTIFIFLFGLSINIDNSSTVQKTHLDIGQNVESANDDCIEKNFWENLESWDLSNFKLDTENQTISVKNKEFYTSATNLEFVPLNFTSYSLAYLALYENGNLSPVLIRLGNKFIDFYIHEENPQLIGLSNTTINKEGEILFSRNKTPLQLNSPPLNNTEIEVNLKYIENQGPEIIYNLSVKYYTKDNPIPITDTFNIKSVSSDPSQNSKIQLGFGTQKQKIINPRSYTICK